VGETRVFTSPSLENVAVRGPSMHDGRHATLDEVVRHYVREVQEGPALDPRLRGPGGAPQRLALSAADERALVAFMRALTDDAMLSDTRFASPFR
jgi:cytochrome c peroxidase